MRGDSGSWFWPHCCKVQAVCKKKTNQSFHGWCFFIQKLCWRQNLNTRVYHQVLEQPPMGVWQITESGVMVTALYGSCHYGSHFPPKAPSCNGRSTMECHNFVLLHSYLFVFDVSWMKDGCHITMMHQIKEFNSPIVLISLSLQLPHPDGSYDNSIQRYKENQVFVQVCVLQMVSSGCWQCNVGANFTSIHQWREATFFLHVCSNGRWLIEK